MLLLVCLFLLFFKAKKKKKKKLIIRDHIHVGLAVSDQTLRPVISTYKSFIHFLEHTKQIKNNKIILYRRLF